MMFVGKTGNLYGGTFYVHIFAPMYDRMSKDLLQGPVNDGMHMETKASARPHRDQQIQRGDEMYCYKIRLGIPYSFIHGSLWKLEESRDSEECAVCL